MEDERIISLYFNRDEAAIEETRIKYGAYCFTVASRILPDKADAEECENDTYLRAWNAIPPERPSSLKLFLARITRNLAFDRYRREHREKRGSAAEVLLDELEECLPSESDTEDEALSQELGERINAFLSALAPRECDVFLRRYFFSETTDAIAKRYGMRESNVLLILSRTRQKLKKHLETEGFNV